LRLIPWLDCRNEKLFDILLDLKRELATSGVYLQRKASLPLDKQIIDVLIEMGLWKLRVVLIL